MYSPKFGLQNSGKKFLCIICIDFLGWIVDITDFLSPCSEYGEVCVREKKVNYKVLVYNMHP